MTVRRDLDTLADHGLIEKVHGGAARVGDLSSFEPGFAAKQDRQRAEKLAIARSAATLVRPGSAIGLTAGTTTWTFASELQAPPDLTVVTNAPSIAQTLYGSTHVSVVLTGGVRTPSDALVGPLATDAVSKLHIDTLFLGVHGMDATLGYSTPNLAEAEINAALIAAAQRVVVLADHTKWGTRGLAQIAPLGRADMVISDDRLPVEAHRAFESAGVELVVVRAGKLAERSA